MENLIKRLEDEAGLTEEQAENALLIMVDFMNKEGLNIDWNKFFKGKYDDFLNKTKKFAKKVTRKTTDLADKVGDKVEDLKIQTRRTARDLSKKVYNSLNDDNEDI